MKGWKSKYGGLILAAGGAFLACSQIMADTNPLMETFKILGTFMTVGGGSLLGVGVAHKIEKGGTK